MNYTSYGPQRGFLYRIHVQDINRLVDKLDHNARVATGLTTLLPGERVEIPIHSSQNLELVQFLDPEVLRHGNQLVVNK